MNFIKFLNKNKFYILFLALGILIFFFPMFKTNFNLIPSDYYSAKISIYILEHFRQYLNHWFEPNLHINFWTIPNADNIQSNLAQYSPLIAIAPIYYCIRLLINSPFDSYQILLIILAILNYSIFYYFLKKNFNFSKLAKAFSSFIFAFGLMRFFQINDIQFMSQFLSVLSLIFLLKVNKNNALMKNHLYLILFSIFAILQFYTSFYLGYFFIFSLILYSLLAFIPKNSRDIIYEYIKNFYIYLIFYMLIIFIMLLPYFYHFYNLENNIILVNEFLSNISKNISWFRNVSLLDNLIFGKFNFDLTSNYSITSFSIGYITTLVTIFGLFKLKKYRGSFSLLLFFIIILSTGIFAKYF